MLKLAHICVDAMTAEEFESLLPCFNGERRLFLENCRSKKIKFTSAAGEMLARLLMSEETGIPAADFVFLKNEFGKPYQKQAKNLHFNISHSDSHIICGLADCEVGVDIQKIIGFRSGIAKYMLAPGEAEVLNSETLETGPATGMTAGKDLVPYYEFLTRMWCRKESYFKLIGTGINCRPSEIDTYGLEKQGYVFTEGKIGECFRYSVCTNGMPGADAAKIKELPLGEFMKKIGK